MRVCVLAAVWEKKNKKLVQKKNRERIRRRSRGISHKKPSPPPPLFPQLETQQLTRRGEKELGGCRRRRRCESQKKHDVKYNPSIPESERKETGIRATTYY